MTNNTINNDVYLDNKKDKKVIEALKVVIEAKALQKKAKQMIEESKIIINDELVSKNIKNAHSDKISFKLSEFVETYLDKELVSKVNKEVYDLCSRERNVSRYLVTER